MANSITKTDPEDLAAMVSSGTRAVWSVGLNTRSLTAMKSSDTRCSTIGGRGHLRQVNVAGANYAKTRRAIADNSSRDNSPCHEVSP